MSSRANRRYANMSDEELADRFKGADEKTLRQMAWRHGYGNMSSHYLDRVKNVMTGKKTATTEAEISEDPQAVGRSLAMLNYGKEMATAIINGGDPDRHQVQGTGLHGRRGQGHQRTRHDVQHKRPQECTR